MIKNSVVVKSFGCALLSTLMAGVIASSISENKEEKIDLSAFKNFSLNLQAIATNESTKKAIELSNNERISARVISQIENELQAKIQQSKVQLRRPISTIQNIAQKNKDIKKIIVEKKSIAVKSKLKNSSFPILQVAAKKSSDEPFIINNKDLIKLYAFKSDEIKAYSFSGLEWSAEELKSLAVTNQEVLQDEVSSIMASQDVEKTDDPILYEYSEVKEAKAPEVTEVVKETKKAFDRKISTSVKAAIARELQKTSKSLDNQTASISTMSTEPVREEKRKKAQVDIEDDKETLNEIMKQEDSVVYDYSQMSLSSNNSNIKEANAATFAGEVINQSVEKQFIIQAREIYLNTQKVKKAQAFEFIPDYDRSERIDDSADGEINIGLSLSGDLNTLSGVLQSKGMIPTRVELNLAESGANIPMINDESIQKFLEIKQMDIQGNLALFAIDRSIKDIELDSAHQSKIFFNKYFKEVSSQDLADYVMYLGVNSGNTLVRYQLSNNETAQKIIYVGDGEMYFEDAEFNKSEREVFTLTTRTLLGKKVKELNIDAGLVGINGSKNKSKKKALNAYEIKIPETVSGSRKYLEFKHLPATIYVGVDNHNEIEIPGMDFIRKVLESHEIDELGQRCLVQVNLDKEISSIKVSGKNKAGEMFTETSFLDSDGNFTTNSTELAEKAFIMGDMEGQFSAKLEYSDGSSQYLKTFCSEGSYLIEQL